MSGGQKLNITIFTLNCFEDEIWLVSLYPAHIHSSKFFAILSAVGQGRFFSPHYIEDKTEATAGVCITQIPQPVGGSRVPVTDRACQAAQ